MRQKIYFAILSFFFPSLKRLRTLADSPVWQAAEEAVGAVSRMGDLQTASGIEPTVSFCPRCGQIPDGDRRFEEARELAIKKLRFQPRRSDLDFALAWHYWSSRK